MNRLVMTISKSSGLLLAALLSLSACNSAPGSSSGVPDASQSKSVDLRGATIGGPFTLENKDGKTVHWSDFDGKYRIVYFGYTYCPDICPTDVQRMSQGLDMFTKAHPELGAKIVPIFISVDPERDTPDKVGEFASAFSDRLVGLTGTPEQVAAAAKKFRVFYSRGEKAPGGGYLVNHSNITYLFDPEGKPLATLPTNEEQGAAQAVAAELARWVH